MCFSATVSYSSAVVLVTTGLYAVRQARRLQPSYRLLALTPLFFGIQQAFEGRVWQMLDSGEAIHAVPYALGFHFFSHFLWLWWIPLSSYIVEPSNNRKKIFLGFTLFGGLAGAIVYLTLLLDPGLMSVSVRSHSIVYTATSPWRGPVSIGIPPSVLYGLIILIPLLFSSHRHMRKFGVLIALSIALASVSYDYAFVSVWCFFAAILSLYLVFMIHVLSQQQQGTSPH